MLLAIISAISAVLAGMGIGGGAIFVLLATTFIEFSQKYAQILNLILFLAVGMTSAITNIKNKNIDYDILKKAAPCLIIGAVVGTGLFKKINNENLKKYFLYFLVIVGIYEIIASVINIKKAKNNNKYRKEN